MAEMYIRALGLCVLLTGVLSGSFVQGQSDKPKPHFNDRLAPGDILAVYIPNVLPMPGSDSDDQMPPVTALPSGQAITGFPFRIASDGTLHLPLIAPVVRVASKTIREAEQAIKQAYIDRGVLTPRHATVVLTKVRQVQIGTKPLKGRTISSGDTIAVYVRGVLPMPPNPREPVSPPITVLASGVPITGFPLSVASDGTINIPLISPVQVKGLTIRDAETAIATSLIQGQILVKRDAQAILTFVD